MYREMRRKVQLLSKEETAAILCSCTSGVLAVMGDDGYPYTVPLSYVYDQQSNKIYFHSAKAGHKIDAVRRSDKTSFCVVEQDQVVPEKFTTHFRSAIAFGRTQIIESGKVWQEAIKKLAARYSPLEDIESIQREIEASPQFVILEMTIEHLTGKEAIELVRKREKGSI